MTLNFDPTDDLATMLDGAESVTLLRRGSMPGSSGTTIVHALRRAATTREAVIRNRYDTWKKAPRDGRLTACDVIWHLPADELTDSPRPGDVILDGAGRRWTILDVQLATLSTRWQCTSRDLTLAYGLDDTISILKATYTKGDCGGAEPTWLMWRTGIRARIQPADTKEDAKQQARQTVARYRIFLEENLAIDHNHRIQGPDGTFYRVTGTVGAERIGEVQSIYVEIVI